MKESNVQKNTIYSVIKSVAAILFPLISFPYASRVLLTWAEHFDGDEMYQAMEDFLRLDDDLCHGLFFSWDNTPAMASAAGSSHRRPRSAFSNMPNG